MADVTISYNNSTVTIINNTQIEVLDTSGKYLEDDITIEYVKPAPNLQGKTVNPTVTSQNVTPDAGYDGLSSVTVNAISPTKSAQTYTPTTTNQTISAGRWLTGAQTIKGDANLTAGNIKKNVSIFGVSGTYEGGPSTSYLVWSGQSITGYNFGTRVPEGAFAARSGVFSISGIESITAIGSRAFYMTAFADGSLWTNNEAFVSSLLSYATYIGSDAFYGASFAASAVLTFANWTGSGGASVLGKGNIANNQGPSVINLPVCQTIPYGFCTSRFELNEISAPSATSIEGGAFAYCRQLTTVNFPACVTLREDSFSHCTSLTTANFPSCTSIGIYAFYSCTQLTTISFPACTSIGNYVFQYCSNLTAADFPSCTSIGSSAFYVCRKLATISFPVCTYIGSNAFYGCSSLTIANFPSCTSIGEYTFGSCSQLTTANFPLCTTIGSGAFSRCTSLTTARFDVDSGDPSLQATLTIYSLAFWHCHRLLSLYILGETVATLTDIAAFDSTPISTYTTYTGGVRGSIFVRASMLASFQTATNWSIYSARMVGLTDEQIAALS